MFKRFCYNRFIGNIRSYQNDSTTKTNMKKNNRLRKVGIIIILLILIVIASYFIVFQNRSGSPSPTIILDEEQKQIDNFLSNYYIAYKEGSAEKILTFFDDNAVLSAPNGKIYEGKSNIAAYYVNLFKGYDSIDHSREVLDVRVRGDEAYATYKVRVRFWSFGATDPPQFFYEDNFSLKKYGDSWKINALLIEFGWKD
jgi:ketosteroid isomerase-like protein